jgi:N-acetylmuramoyl-L-alanine amidase
VAWPRRLAVLLLTALAGVVTGTGVALGLTSHGTNVSAGGIASPAIGGAAPARASTADGAMPARRPAVVQMPIAYGSKRRTEMAAYARRHYGLSSWHLTPRVIVEHYTAGTTFESAFSTFAADVPDAELGELPGTCAHFVIDRDGTIYQLVPTSVMCRHTVGLNYTAIGIEHVGLSDEEILRRPAQLNASLRLTVWLMQQHRIALGNVIGHNESLTSAYHKELYRSWRCQTHGDWTKADMDIYRARLRARATANRVPLGKPVRRVDPNC